jgi:hypothetical protein
MKRQRGIVRTKAYLAKQRLRHGTWHLVKQTATKENQKEDLLYTDVARLLGCGVSNPLTHLLDRAHMNELTTIERERYVLGLSVQVQECVERFRKAN